MEVKIDSEFHSLIPALSPEEYRQLEANIIAEGCRDSLITWQGFIIDGHNRYAICNEHNIEFNVSEKQFDSKDDVKIWIINNQFGRRNLSLFQRAELALILKPLFEKKAKENQLSGLKQYQDDPVYQNSDKRNEPISTQKEIAKVAGVSHDTIARVEKIIEKAPEEIKQQVRNNEISINEAYKSVVKPHVTNGTGDNEWNTNPEIVESARIVLGNIDLDPASSITANTIVKANEIYTIDIDGLKQEWHGNIWLNPPYSVSENPKFIDKLVNEYNLDHVKSALVLVNNATETKWFNNLVSISKAICFPIGRLKFWSPEDKGSTPLQGQAILYIGNNIDLFLNEFGKYGWCAIIQ